MTEPRSVCWVCQKPTVTCVCARIPRVSHRTGIFVVQHPRERLHSIGTARFARLGLENARVEVAWNAGVAEDAAPPWLPAGAALLYPGPAARDLRSMTEAERPTDLVVIDGTWHTARTLYRDKGWLRALPQVSLSPAEPSRYRIRREPERHCVSTIEAIAEALRILEPEIAGLGELLGAFDSMIDDQLEYIRRGSAEPRTRDKRPPSFRRVPRALVEDFSRLVVSYAESSRPDCRGTREIVQFAAVHLRSGRTFERVLRPSFGLPSDTHLGHMGLRPADFDGSIPRAAFAGEWATFLRSVEAAPIVSAWNQTTLDLLAELVGGPASRVSLKSAYRNGRGGGCGSLDEVARDEQIDAAPLPFLGRAAVRVARAEAVARRLNERAVVDVPEGATAPFREPSRTPIAP
ncbi:MAG TPA: tRNA-uridine aminocarboxypropyltransferase [Polyangiaceae bacterium]|nr:tRNA-uridine aminocarboxypropyltransferase [Polyangiaceae bacterium]